MLAQFNALTPERAEEELLACCAAAAWARAVAGGRPYPDLAAALAAGDAAMALLSWAEIAAALAAHPRIGERAGGSGRDAAWSRREQARVSRGDEETAGALAEANREYEQRFGHLFLVFATGRTPDELLAVARARLGNDPADERLVVRTELGKIARLRLARMLSGGEVT